MFPWLTATTCGRPWLLMVNPWLFMVEPVGWLKYHGLPQCQSWTSMVDLHFPWSIVRLTLMAFLSNFEISFSIYVLWLLGWFLLCSLELINCLCTRKITYALLICQNEHTNKFFRLEYFVDSTRWLYLSVSFVLKSLVITD